MTFATVALLLAGCQQDVTEVAGPGGGGPPVDTSGTGGTVQRITITARFELDPADSAVARQLGLASGVLPDADVVARREGSSDRATGRTDARGVVRLPNLLPGRWSLSASRVLTDAERQQLRAEDRDVTAWAGGASGQVNISATVPVSIVAGRRGSLVISEIFEFSPPTATYQTHPWGTYLELYNNSDTTIYLDGKIVGKMLPNVMYDLATRSCASTAAARLDTLGVWSREFWGFPGAGHDHPILPGQAKVVAIDAIDHRIFNAELLDLSRADFEMFGTQQDVDNPTAPNLTALGSGRGVEGHGMSMTFTDAFFVANATPYTEIRDSLFFCTETCSQVWRVPAILDVFTKDYDRVISGISPMCSPLLDRQYERQPAALSDFAKTGSLVRRAAYQTGERSVLQRTRTSARDWQRVPTPTPGSVP